MLSSAEIGILATVGVTRIEVCARPIVGVLSTGDELLPPYATCTAATRRHTPHTRRVLQFLLAAICPLTQHEPYHMRALRTGIHPDPLKTRVDIHPRPLKCLCCVCELRLIFCRRVCRSEPLAYGKVRDSNRLMLLSAATESGVSMALSLRFEHPCTHTHTHTQRLYQCIC